MKNKKLQLVFLLEYVILANLFVFLVRPNYLINILIVYFPPMLVNFYWLNRSRWKIFIFALVTTMLFAPPVEIAARLADAWDVQSVLPRLFGLAPTENLIYAFVNFFWPLVFYEYFIDRDRSKKISLRWKYLVAAYIILSVSAYSIFAYKRELLTVNYWLIGLIVTLFPCLVIFYLKPQLLKKIIIPTVFFGFIFFVHEVISLELGHWWWPGEYMYTIYLNGKIFPLDDALIWYVLSTPALIAGYEFFMDDGK